MKELLNESRKVGGAGRLASRTLRRAQTDLARLVKLEEAVQQNYRPAIRKALIREWSCPTSGHLCTFEVASEVWRVDVLREKAIMEVPDILVFENGSDIPFTSFGLTDSATMRPNTYIFTRSGKYDLKVQETEGVIKLRIYELEHGEPRPSAKGITHSHTNKR